MNLRLSNIISSLACSALLLATFLAIAHSTHTVARAQTEDAFGDAGADPLKLFERGQNAHARGNLIKALEFYEEALKVRPEFPEAEFQKGNVLFSLGRFPESESSLRRAIELRKDWSLPYVSLGILFVRLNRDTEAEPVLRQALKLDAHNNLALRVLADVRLRAGDAKDALQLATRATSDQEAPLATWLLRAQAERRSGNTTDALMSLDHVLKIEPLNLPALLDRAELRLTDGKIAEAIEDLKAAEPLIKTDKASASRLASVYETARKPDDALRVAKAAGLSITETSPSTTGAKVIGEKEEIEAANSEDPAVASAALEKLLKKNPNNPALLARLGESYRTTDPDRALDFYRRAAALQPDNVDYATGYSSALVQARRFPEAVVILRRVIKITPDHYAAHANLATALYRLKSYAEALAEYQWLLKTKPDLTVAHYFIATAHDYLGEYEDALAAYEVFLAGANVKINELEIEKVKLRLPKLRRQIQLGQGVKRKTGVSK
jgi:tetratricopeptide (TPR) repeat protein